MKELYEKILQGYKSGDLDQDIADIITRMIEVELKALHKN